jgi:hypothetical protein
MPCRPNAREREGEESETTNKKEGERKALTEKSLNVLRERVEER